VSGVDQPTDERPADRTARSRNEYTHREPPSFAVFESQDAPRTRADQDRFAQRTT
jgi:hypothetical protein